MGVMTISGKEVHFNGQWIPVQEDKPAEHCEVLASSLDGIVSVAVRTKDGMWYGDMYDSDEGKGVVDMGSKCKDCHVIAAWMPMPELDAWISCKDRMPAADEYVVTYSTLEEAYRVNFWMNDLEDPEEYSFDDWSDGYYWRFHDDRGWSRPDHGMPPTLMHDGTRLFDEIDLWIPLPRPFNVEAYVQKTTSIEIAKKLIKDGTLSVQDIAACVGLMQEDVEALASGSNS